jgi:hypothetical protein
MFQNYRKSLSKEENMRLTMEKVVAYILNRVDFEDNVSKPSVEKVVAILLAEVVVDEKTGIIWDSNVTEVDEKTGGIIWNSSITDSEEKRKRLVQRSIRSVEVVSTFPGFKSWRQDVGDSSLTDANSSSNSIEDGIIRILVCPTVVKEEESSPKKKKMKVMYSPSAVEKVLAWLDGAAIVPEGWHEKEKVEHCRHASHVLDRCLERVVNWEEKLSFFPIVDEDMEYFYETDAKHSFDVTAFTEGAEARMDVCFFPPHFANDRYINGGLIKSFINYSGDKEDQTYIIIMFENGYNLLLIPGNCMFAISTAISQVQGAIQYEFTVNGINPKAHPTRSVIAWRAAMKGWFSRNVFELVIKAFENLPGFHSFSNDTELGSKGHSFDIGKLKASATAGAAIFGESANVKLSPPTFMGGEAAFLWQPLKNDFNNIFIGFESGRYIGLVKGCKSSFVKKALEIQQCWIKHYKL